MKVLLDSKELSEVLGIPVSTVRYYVRERNMPCLKIGKHKRFSMDEIFKWIDKDKDGRS